MKLEKIKALLEGIAKNNAKEISQDHFEAARQIHNFIRHPDVDKTKLPVRFASKKHISSYIQENPSRAAALLDKLHKHYPHVAKKMNQSPVTRREYDAASSNSFSKGKHTDNYRDLMFREEFDAEAMIEHLLDEGHSIEEIQDFIENDFESVLQALAGQQALDEAKSSKKKAVKPAYGSESWKRAQQWGGGREHNEDPDTADEKRKARKLAGLDEGLLRTIDKATGSHLQKRRIRAKNNFDLKQIDQLKIDPVTKDEKDLVKKAHRDPDFIKTASKYSMFGRGSRHLTGGSNKQLTRNIKKAFHEEFDTTDLTEELLMEIKMKLKPGQKITPKQFAKMKADVLAKQKAKAEAKIAPKPEPKEETIENDDTNRNARILKGQFPWGKVTPELAKTAIAKLKQIEKPADRLAAIGHIWDKSEHFHALIKNGKIDAPVKEKETPKSKITLAKVRGVN